MTNTHGLVSVQYEIKDYIFFSKWLDFKAAPKYTNNIPIYITNAGKTSFLIRNTLFIVCVGRFTTVQGISYLQI